MKRTISKLLGMAALAITAFAVTPAYAYTEANITNTNSQGQSWTCTQQNAGTYAQNGHYYYCGDPNLPINQLSHKNGYMTALQSLPAYTQTQMNAQGVDVTVFCTAREYEIYYNGTITLPAGATRRSLASFYQPGTKRIAVFQYLTDVGQDCSTPTGTGSNNKVAIYSQGYGLMRHEIGHFIDIHMNVPANQYKHSLNKTTAPIPLYRQYLQKDIDWINDPVRAGHLIPCNNLFTSSTRDVFVNGSGVTTPICSGSTLNSAFTGFSNFQIMSSIKGFNYFLTRYVETTGLPTTETWRELFPETFPYSVGTVGTGPSGAASDFYLNGSYFLCSKRYVEIVSKTGAPPQAADLLSPYNRCVLTP